MSRFQNEVSPEALKKSFINRDYLIDWRTLKPFKYNGRQKPEALDGWTICHKYRVRIGIARDPITNPTDLMRVIQVNGLLNN